MDKIFDIKLPFSYWVNHALIAVAIMIAVMIVTFSPVAGWLAGVMFYVGRELRDREKLGEWDWPGLVSPIVATTILFVIITLIF